jgi:hypothetical protein
MILTNDQLTFLRSKARFTFIKVKENIDQKEDWPIGVIDSALQDAVGMGYAVAMHEVRSTPWEYSIDVAEEEHMNAQADDGWEYVSIFTDPRRNVAQVVWRRRRAVGELEIAPTTSEPRESTVE